MLEHVIIAIDENLHHIKTGLQQLGYSVVDLKENQLTDVIIYYRDSQSNILKGIYIIFLWSWCRIRDSL